jgi:hypothetical protein
VSLSRAPCLRALGWCFVGAIIGLHPCTARGADLLDAEPSTNSTDVAARVAAPCARPAELDRFWESLRVELAGEGVSWVEGPLDPAVEVSVQLALATCHPPPASMTVTVSRRDGTARSRSVALNGVASPPGARTTALIVAEFVRAAVQDLVEGQRVKAADADTVALSAGAAEPPDGSPDSEPEMSRTTSALPERAVTDPERASLWARVPPVTASVSAELFQRVYPRHGTSFLGARAAAAYPLNRSWAAWASGSSGWGAAQDALGTAALWCTSASVGAWFVLPSAPIQLEIGPELELGYARARGRVSAETAAATSADALVLLTGFDARVVGQLGPGWRIFVTTQVGYTLLGVTWKADGRRLGGLEGPTFATAVGAALSL